MSFLKKLFGKYSCENNASEYYPQFSDATPIKTILDKYVGENYSLLIAGPIQTALTRESTGIECRHLQTATPNLGQIIKAKASSSETPQVLVISAWFENKENIHRIARKLAPYYSYLVVVYADKGRFPEASKLGESLLTRNKFISKFIKSYTLTEELFCNSLGIYLFQRTK